MCKNISNISPIILKFINVLILFLLFYMNPLYAVDVSDQTVCAVQMDVNGRVNLQPCTNWISINNCANGWTEWYENEGQGGGKGMHAIALAAMMSGKKVTLRVGSGCSNGWDHLMGIRVYQ